MVEDYNKYVEYNRDGTIKKVNFEKKEDKKGNGKDPFNSFEVKFNANDKKK